MGVSGQLALQAAHLHGHGAIGAGSNHASHLLEEIGNALEAFKAEVAAGACVGELQGGLIKKDGG